MERCGELRNAADPEFTHTRVKRAGVWAKGAGISLAPGAILAAHRRGRRRARQASPGSRSRPRGDHRNNDCRVHSAIEAFTAIEAAFEARPRSRPVFFFKRQPRLAASIAAMSIFTIPIIALNARSAAAGSGSAIAAVRTRGVICHDSPHLSLHQPQTLSSPPFSTIAFHKRSVSAWSSVATETTMLGCA